MSCRVVLISPIRFLPVQMLLEIPGLRHEVFALPRRNGWFSGFLRNEASLTNESVECSFDVQFLEVCGPRLLPMPDNLSREVSIHFGDVLRRPAGSYDCRLEW